MSIVLLCALAVEWLVLPFSKNPFIFAPLIIIIAGVIFFSHLEHNESLRELGYRFDNFSACLRLLALPMLAFSAALVVLGWSFGSLHFGDISGWSLKKYTLLLASALIQQHVLQAFFNRRAERVWSKGFLSAVAAAAIFALLHLPNFWLTVATFLGGLMWAIVYQRVPNLFALALSHAIMSGVLVLSVSPSALQGMRVGYSYFNYKF